MMPSRITAYPYMRAYRRPIEELKPPEERGKYQHPEFYGMPEELGMHYTPDLERTEKEPRLAKVRPGADSNVAGEIK